MSQMPLDLVSMTEHLRALVTRHPDKSRLSLECGVTYPRLGYLVRNPGSLMRADDLQKLMTYYGFDVTIGSPPFPPEGWREHPTAPGWFYKGQRVLTEAQLRAEVAQAVVAE